MVHSANKKKVIQFKQPDVNGDEVDIDELPGHVTDDYQ